MSPLRRILAAVSTSLAVTVGAADAHAARESGIQITLDERAVLVNKDVGDARWAISYDRGTTTAIGNVFFSAGDPGFLYCRKQAIGDVFECYGADPCDAGRCASAFGVIAAVELPSSFFATAGSTGAPVLGRSMEIAATDAPPAVGAAETRSSGIQHTPDGRQVMVNKDVGGARWAITYNRDDGTLTGNVFFPGGGPPVFLFCDPLAPPTRFSCYGADACTTATCIDQYAFIQDVTLPADFLGDATATCGNGVEEPGERCEVGGRCQLICGLDAFCFIEIGVAPIPVFGVCSDDCGRCRPSEE